MKDNQLPLLMVCLMLAMALIAGCTMASPIATIFLIDQSKSALEDEQFAEIAEESCHSFVRGLLPGDLTRSITVNSTTPKASDLTEVLDPRRYHADCKPTEADGVLVSTSQGTFSCPAWRQARDLSHRQSAASLPVLYLSVIQTNELEIPCPQIWQQLAEDAQKRDGKLVIVASSTGEASNQALDGSFNQLLWQHLQDYESVVFCADSNVKGCIEQAYIDIRQPSRGES